MEVGQVLGAQGSQGTPSAICLMISPRIFLKTVCCLFKKLRAPPALAPVTCGKRRVQTVGAESGAVAVLQFDHFKPKCETIGLHKVRFLALIYA